MDLGELETRAGQLISELSDIIQRLETDIGDPKKAISFGQVKEIEASIARMKKQGLPVPAELNELKIRLFSEQVRHQERIALYQKVKESIEGLLDRVTIRMPKRIQVGHANAVQLTHRKPYNYKKPLGSKGYSNVDDYLIPVIKLM